MATNAKTKIIYVQGWKPVSYGGEMLFDSELKAELFDILNTNDLVKDNMEILDIQDAVEELFNNPKFIKLFIDKKPSMK